MALISVSNINKSFGAFEVLEDISFLIEEGDKIGLVGLNGVGKSTLLKILAGEIFADGGDISVAKDCSIRYLAQGTSFDGHDTIGEALEATFEIQFRRETQLRELETKISDPEFFNDESKLDSLLRQYAAISEEYKDAGGYEMRSRIRGVMGGLGFEDPDDLIIKLSGGQKTRLALGCLLLENPDLLLLDEPTNYLDMASVEWLETFLKDYPGAFLVVSHDRYFLDNSVSTIFELTHGRISSYRGNYSQFMREKQKRIRLQEKHDALRDKEMERLRDNVETFISHRNYAQARVRQRKLEELLPKVKDVDGGKTPIKLSFKGNAVGGKEVLQIENIGFAYDHHEILQDVSLNVYRGERIGIIGSNGIGKTTLLKVLAGHLSPSAGNLRYGHQIKPTFLAQEKENLSEDNTVLDEVWNSAPDLSLTQVRTFLGGLLFSGDDVERRVGVLSGGEKSRISLAKAILQGANVLLLDEPTNHLDILSKERLEEALLDFEGTIIAVSHDRYFLSRIATRIWEFTDDGINDIMGGFSYYLEKKAERESDDDFEDIVENKTRLRKARRKEKMERDAERRRQDRIKRIEDKIIEREAEVEEIELLLCKPEVYSDPQRSRDVNARYQQLMAELEDLYESFV